MSNSNEQRSKAKKAVFIILACVSILLAAFRVIQRFNRDTNEQEVQKRWVENGKRIDELKQQPFGTFPNHGSAWPQPKINFEALQTIGSGKAVISDFLKEIHADNLKAAYEMTSASFRQRVGPEDFEIMIRQQPGINESDRCRIIGTIRDANGTASFQLDNPPKDAVNTVIEIGLKKETTWMVDEFTVKSIVP